MAEGKKIQYALISRSDHWLYVQTDLMTSEQHWWVSPGMAEAQRMGFGEDLDVAYSLARHAFSDIDPIPWEEVKWSDEWPPPQLR